MNVEPEDLLAEIPEVEPAPRRRAFPVLWQAIVLCVLFLALQVAIGVVLSLVAMAFGHADAVAAVTAVANLIAFGLVFLVARLWSGLPVATLFPLRRFRPSLLVPLTLSVLGLHILLSETDNVVRYFLPIPQVLAEMLQQMTGPSWAGLLVVVAVAPLTEEPFFRGIVLGGFLRNYRPGVAVVLTSLLFGLVHLNPWQFASAFALGLLFSWCLMRTGSLWPCLFGHTLANGLSMAMEQLPIPIVGYNVIVPDTPFQPPWFDLIGLLLVLCGIAWLRKIFAAEDARRKTEATNPSPTPPE